MIVRVATRPRATFPSMVLASGHHPSVTHFASMGMVIVGPEGPRACIGATSTSFPLLVAVAPVREQRERVTILSCDVTGSTALGESTEPEALRCLTVRYFEQMKGIIESHGGTVDKFIGDAVMAAISRATPSATWLRCYSEPGECRKRQSSWKRRWSGTRPNATWPCLPNSGRG